MNPTPPPPHSRCATWGAARATKATGPATDVADATSRIATTIRSTRVRLTLTPRPVATSSPIATSPRGTAKTAHTTTTAPTTISRGIRRARVTPENEPALHSCARCAASSGALTMSSELTARNAAEQPMPTRTTRIPVTRMPPAHARMIAPETSPPSKAPTPVTVGLEPRMMIAIRAPVAQPVDRPTMSGLPSGLPEIVWKIRPAIPSATPTPIAASMRGRRTDWTK